MSSIVLASASPRRAELLKEIFSEFEVFPADLDESVHTVRDPFDTAVALARAKAEKIARLRPGALVIGADTVVTIGDVQLAKPEDGDDAKRMLRLLSGKTHSVITGVCLCTSEPDGTRAKCFADETQVTFRILEAREMDAYVKTGEPMDKAGAYAIQGGAKSFVESIEGSVSNVVGLPLEKLREVLSHEC